MDKFFVKDAYVNEWKYPAGAFQGQKEDHARLEREHR